MRCDACKIRFLKAPWFIGHLVRCPKWKENPKDVLDYFALVSKKKLVILKRPPGNRKKTSRSNKENPSEAKKPPTCFTCFCGQEFLSQALHATHVQQCLNKVMSSKKDVQVTIKPAQPETVIIKHEVVEMDHGQYKVVFHDSKGKDVPSAKEATIDFDMEVTVRGAGGAVQSQNDNENVVVIVNEPAQKTAKTEEMSCPGRPDMVDDSLPSEELDETVMRLEYFEEAELDDSHQENVANEVEVGTYEEEESIPNDEGETVEETVVEESTPSPEPIFTVKSEPTLDIEGTVCDCGRRLSNADLLTEHLKVCKYYGSDKSPVKRTAAKKTVVLINCVCKAQFTKTTIKQHLLRCDVWRHVKMKKNLIPATSNVEYVDYGETTRQNIHVSHLRADNPEEAEQVCEESYEQEIITSSDDLIEEIPPIAEDQQSGLQIGEVVTVADVAVSQESATAATEKGESPVQPEDVVPNVRYNCECGGNFRHLNVFKVHQASCDVHFVAQGKPLKSPQPQQSPKIRKEDILLKYDKPAKGEVLQRCECGFKINSIFAYRQHQSGCLALLSKKSKSDSLKKSSSQKRVSFAAEGTSKRSKVELHDELKDMVKIEQPKKKK